MPRRKSAPERLDSEKRRRIHEEAQITKPAEPARAFEVDFDSEVLWEDGARTPPPPSPKRRRSSSVKRKPRPLSVPLQSKLALPAGIILGEITFEATFTEGWVGQDPCELQAADLAVLDGTCKVHQNKKDVGSLNWQNPELNDVVKGLGYLGHAQAILLIPKISASKDAMSITVCIQDDNSNMVVQGHLYPENDISSTRFFTFTDRLMRWFQPKLFVQDESIPDIEPDVIYSLAKSKQQHWPTIPQPEQLLHPLRSYQAQAVRWMVDREQTPTTEGRSLHALWRQCQAADRRTYYYQPFAGLFSLTRPTRPPTVRGGILADEMGLGKTVEVLGCIITNPRELPALEEDAMEDVIDASISELDGVDVTCTCGGIKNPKKVTPMICTQCGCCQHAECTGYISGPFICISCTMKRPQIQAKTTLIVSPGNLAAQWIEEIVKHTGSSLNVLHYNGVSSQFIRPATLASYDVIVSTYEVLRNEVYHLDAGVKHRGRHNARYLPVPSPLTQINWWRICLDEAQMVEKSTSKAAEVASQLQSEHRWCVTGTPISRGLDDLFGLVMFLRARPFCHAKWWRVGMSDKSDVAFDEDIAPANSGLASELAILLWRNTKQDVADSLLLPEQTENERRFGMDPVGRYFYSRLQEECTFDARKVLRRFRKDNDLDRPLSSLNSKDSSKLLAPLLRLRQACVHPAMSQNTQKNGVSMIKGSSRPRDMREVVQAMVAKAKNDCTDAFRALIMARNGCAAICLLKGQPEEAIEIYRKAIAYSDAERKLYTVDEFQLLHALENLSRELTAKITRAETEGEADGEVPVALLALERDSCARRSKELFDSKAHQANELVRAKRKVLSETSSKIDFDTMGWAMEALDTVPAYEEAEFISSLRSDITPTVKGHNYRGLVDQFSSLAGLKSTLVREFTNIKKTRGNVLKDLASLTVLPSKDKIREMALCSSCRSPPLYGTCDFCKASQVHQVYDKLLFKNPTLSTVVVGEAAKKDEEFRYLKPSHTLQGAHSELEDILHKIFSRVRHQPRLSQLGKDCLAMIQTLKQEFLQLRAVWTALWDRISIYDELSMCTLKLQLRVEGADIPKELQELYVEKYKISHREQKYLSETKEWSLKLVRLKGRFTYLKNLAETSENGEQQRLCVVCRDDMTAQYGILACGHCFCFDCTRLLTNRRKMVKCATCRQETETASVEYVTTHAVDDDDAVEVKGYHSAKVKAVVRCLLKILESDSSAKSIVFSQWSSVLEIIKRALDENEISAVLTSSGRKFAKSLSAFKSDPAQQVLLLPLKSGANGLNIVEATHVLLVEPSVSKAMELQAVGRVHRIGQTKPTFVHRFIIEDTIEEKVRAMNVSQSDTLVRSSRNQETSMLRVNDVAQMFQMGSMAIDSGKAEEVNEEASEVTDGAAAESNDNVMCL